MLTGSRADNEFCLARLSEPAIIANPYPFYERLRRHAPVHFDADIHAWLISRYADVLSVLRDARFHRRRDRIEVDDVHGPLGALSGAFSRQMLFVDPATHARLRAGQAVMELSDHLQPLLQQRRVSPRDDLLSALVLAEEKGQVLDQEEIVANVLLLLIAGHETTTHLIGSGVLALRDHPGEKQTLDRDPELYAGAIEELLRFTNPVQFTMVIAGEPVTMAGQSIAAGQYVFLMLAAANRDPDQWHDPERLDITRRNNRHLAFGHGPHYCIGAALARLEAEIALRVLFDRAPEPRIDRDALAWQLSMGFRGPSVMPIEW